ncbi:MAG: efflux RND transporter periplasmic adaptor subunit [Rhodospirillales bacterium]|nr:efflux RND transporter periplasmic adaptor subunit [Rhodospirillales bacterium]
MTGFIARAAGPLLIAAALAGCKKNNTYVAPPPPQVGVAKPLSQAVTPYLDLTGSAVAFNQVSLDARVEGYLQAINYQDGAEVKKGTPLFVIEPAPFQAKLQQAQATLAAAKAALVQAEAEFTRQSTLSRNDFASQSKVDEARAKRDSDRADVTNAEAGVALAAINLSYTQVLAPFDGVATKHLQSVGELVGVTGPTQLAILIQIAPIYVTFTVSEQDVLRIRKALAARGQALGPLDKIPVEIGLMNEQGYPHKGVLNYISPAIDPSTGTLTVRAILQNKDRALLPGNFVRVRVPLAVQAGTALLVPDVALGTDQQGRYVLVVGPDGKVAQHVVQTGQSYGQLRVIESGLKPDDEVVISGIQHAIPGDPVKAVPAAMPKLPASGQ